MSGGGEFGDGVNGVEAWDRVRVVVVVGMENGENRGEGEWWERVGSVGEEGDGDEAETRPDGGVGTGRGGCETVGVIEYGSMSDLDGDEVAGGVVLDVEAELD